MFEIKLSADELVAKLLRLSESEPVYILDSSGVGHLGSHLLIAGVRPVEILEFDDADAEETLRTLEKTLAQDRAAIFTLSYDFGAKLILGSYQRREQANSEPDAFVAFFDTLIVHDYDLGRTTVVGPGQKSSTIADLLLSQPLDLEALDMAPRKASPVISNFTKWEYVAAVECIREHIRDGDTYQTNLTQQLRCTLSSDTKAETIYWRLRRDHPAPFSAFIRRPDSTVISASPERFFRVAPDKCIEMSPIKGTRARGKTIDEDDQLRAELLSSSKDRAENTMIVDLVRNDLGRVCEYGSVVVKKLCDLEEHPTLFHLVSTVRGKLRADVRFADIISAVFPCGSITGAPKIRTIKIIDEIENASRGLSMGAIGVFLPEAWEFDGAPIDSTFDLSVAIRTMVVRDREVTFNVGGGIVIDSDPESEFDESLLKAQALVAAIGSSLSNPKV